MCSGLSDGCCCIGRRVEDMMLSIRGGSGLGDALYLQSVARYLVELGHSVEACCNWPEVFLPLGDRVRVTGFRRTSIDRLAHYSMRRQYATTQWEDVCISAGIPTDTPLRLDWERTGVFVNDVIDRAAGKPIVLVQMPRAPFARKDGYGEELLPDCNVIQRVIDALSDCFVVQIGLGMPVFAFERLSLDLKNRTSVSDLIDLAQACDGFVGPVSFIVPLAESLEKRVLLIWSRRGLHSKHEPVRRITPTKIIHRKDLFSVAFDDCSASDLRLAVDALRGSIRRREAA